MRFLSTIEDAAAVAYDDANSGLDASEVQSAIDNLTEIVSTGGNASPQGTWLVAGGGVAWVANYTFDVAAAQYFIAGVAHTSAADQVALSAPDGTFNRFDIIAVDATGSVVVLEGTPSAAPELPDVDPTQYLLLTIVRVDTGTTEPSQITTVTVYAENLGTGGGEWAGTTSGSGWTLGSTNNPHLGTKDVEATAVANGAYVQWTAAAPIDVTTRNALVLYVRSKATWANAKSLNITIRNNGVVVGSTIAVKTGFFGFDSSITSGYQLVTIPITQFNLAAGTTADQLRIAVSGGGASIGFYLDDIQFQANANEPPISFLTQAQGDARYCQRAANLSDVTSASTARTNLGLGSISTQSIPTGIAYGNGSAISAATIGTGLQLVGSTLSCTVTGGATTFDGLSDVTLTAVTTGDFVRFDGVSWVNTAFSAAYITTGTLVVARGGTGVGTLTGIVKGNGTSAFSAASEGTDYLSGASAKLPQPYSFGGSNADATGDDLTPRHYVEYAATVTRLVLSTNANTSGDFTIRVKRSADSGSTFPDTVATVTVSSGTRLGTTTSLTTSSLAAGDLLRCDITAITGTVAGWMCRVVTQEKNQ